MLLKLFTPARNLLKATNFWKDNYLILREFKHFRKIAILALIFSFLAASFEGVSIGLLLSFLQNLTEPNAKPIQIGINWFDIWILGVNTSATSRLYRISGLIFLSVWIRSLFNYLSNVYIEVSQLNLLAHLRQQIFEQLQALSLSYFAKTKSGEIVNTITSETERIKSVFNGSAFLITRALTVLIYVLSIVWISWQLSIISVMLFSLLVVGLSTLNKRVREASFEISKASGYFTSTAMEFINGIRTVQAFATQDFERKRFYQATWNLVSTSDKVVKLSAMVKPLAEGLATTLLVGMIIIAFTLFVAKGTLPVGSLLTFFFVLFRLVPILQDINGVRAHLASLQGAVENIKELLRTDNKKYFKNGKTEFLGLNHSIDLVSVDFAYDTSNLILNNITLTIKRGQMTALVGASGAGKTTLADLIPRFYDPTQGQVLIDGLDLREIEINSLRRKLAVVSQDTFIFNTSVWNNIAYGTERATEAAIEEAARQANALEFIQEMPEGFETVLGDRGVRLSGGQRQRIAIARALLRNPDILILDEATSALDSVSERLIQDSLEKLSVGRTVIAIAHRLSTIAKADKVVVLEQGRIVEQGKYQELLERRGNLWKYHQMQHELGKVE
ncbi:ABC transporter ATP-binding protein/permease [Funiculus sociatus GB2-A5]|uniref:ABC transporter ATP-binding protein/permease n=1 Tax=Funiculus sociatus GB2-A5 TaxID=2933946 RepID=A0ABV0JVQ3_9CYAN|nr:MULTISPECIES: heterocyst formation ABC transporter subunit HepA [unclassified Trichocoleus]MBD1907411.1 ABC transporter ATP-binding protein [Trichocoleus sp. FACHB-832]MBD2063188.1 ABC transporter ATP-binding protein [Trichocoleus sp. FACHB-6]